MNESLPPLRSLAETMNTERVQFFDDEGIEIPPGTYARPDRRTGPGTSRRIGWLIIAGTAATALVSGLLLGRLLPR